MITDFTPAGTAQALVEAEDPLDVAIALASSNPISKGTLEILKKARGLYKQGKVKEADDLLAEAGRRGPKGNGTVDAALNVPGRAQSRINLMTGDNKVGWEHVVNRHFNSSKNASQFTISQSELKSLLQTKEVVSSPVTKMLQSNDGVRYVREVNLGRSVGVDRFTGQPTSTVSVLTDRAGNLIAATPGVVK